MKDIEKVCANYEAKLRQREKGRSDESWIKTRVEHYRTALAHNREVELATSQILDTEGVSVVAYPFYYAFARSVDKLVRHGVSGESLAVEAALLIGLWVGRGLSQSVLETIRTQVFNVGAPTP
jgi:hypothetical protein